jgi:hypothetical protein
LQKLLEQRLKQYVSQTRSIIHDSEAIEKKKESCARRGAEIVRVKAEGKVTGEKKGSESPEVFYTVHLKYLIKQKNEFYLEEGIEHRKAEFYKGILVDDEEINLFGQEQVSAPDSADSGEAFEERAQKAKQIKYRFDRLKAVQYAERWWNDYNPAYKKFDVDCTNYISQCLHAGGAPMRGYPQRANGWWMMNSNWSFSWTVANSMRWYLPSSKNGLRAKEADSANQLNLGDVICYDFQGDGRFDHTTIVTAKDANGMPLVNAHTHNSRKRYWAYEDSTAYTPNIKYKFFSIVDNQ